MKISSFVVIWFLIPMLGKGQVNTGDLQALLSSPDRMKKGGISSVEQVQQFYSFSGYTAVWMTPGGQVVYNELMRLIKTAKLEALNPDDYAAAFLGENRYLAATAGDSLMMELRITDAAIRLFTDIANGNISPAFSYDGLSHVPPVEPVLQQLFSAIKNNSLRKLADKYDAALLQIKSILAELKIYIAAMSMPGFSEEKIISAKVSVSNKPLCKKLLALGCADSFSNAAPDSLVRNAVKRAQEKFDLLNDGVLRATALEALNIPLDERLKRLTLAVNYYRWLHSLTQSQRVIVVNIPAAYLKVFDRYETLLEMRLVVGKPSTPTPTLTSRVSEVILYPYWVVPSSIITNEILPVLRRNPGYINANNFQVLDKRGRIIDPYKIDWNNVSASRFPYIIRQSTGCDNALGLLKLNFYNPYTVYLHDTPSKTLFMTRKRYYSHGCMRMEKPMELGHLVLGSNRIAIDTLEEKGCLKNQAPVVVPAKNKLAVVVWYNPADINAKGRIVFYEDIYKKFKNNIPVR